ncbi:glycosyltransferase [Actinomycetaceae bacterium TAE3-ERU4]|nr:glycosyltransferase [Actinomycetaceae bacterium TAE3-ERU4]
MKSDSNKPLKVAQFCDNYGPGSNGLMFAVQQLEGALLDAGHEVVVVVPKACGPNPHAGRPGRTEVRLSSMRVPRMPTRVATTYGFKKALSRIEKLRPDVLHVHGLGPVGILGVLAAKRLNLPLILTWHTDFEAYADHYKIVLPLLIPVIKWFATSTGGDVWDRADLRQAKRIYDDKNRVVAQLLGVCRAMIESADVVTCPSGKTLKRCKDIYPQVTGKIIPNGVDPLPSGPPPFAHPQGPLVTYAGRIAPEKGIHLLVEAFNLVHKTHPTAKLMVVGNWEPYPAIREVLARGQEQGIIILPGEQRREDLGAFYQMSDLFVFPSQTDTQALVLHEAALAGLPIVSVDSELDLVVNPGVNGDFSEPTPEELAKTIGQVLDKLSDPNWAQTASAESKRLAGQWSIKSQSRAYLDLYAEIATLGPSH